MNNQPVFKVRQKVYVSDPRMPQYRRRVTVRGFLDGGSLGTFLTCTDDLGNQLILRPEEVSVQKPYLS
jgi:hypothetical protein